MFKKLFGSKQAKVETIIAPLQGRLASIEEVPDPTFSEKMLGEGVAIIPEMGKVVSPVNGEVIQLFPTKHAIGIHSEKGLEILIHIGLETVAMKGEGFISHVKVGDKVKAGDLLIEFSLELVKERAAHTITPIVITNSEKIKKLDVEPQSPVTIGNSPIMKVELKD